MHRAERERRAERARGQAQRLAAQGVAAVALTWVDNGGVTRVKAVPTPALAQAAAWGVGATPVFDFFLPDDSITGGRYSGGPTGDLRLLPDLDRLVPLAAQPGWAWAPVDRWTQAGERHPRCTRALLIRLTAELADLGLSARAAIEVEWVLDRGTGAAPVPAAAGPAYGMARIVECSDVGADLLRALAAQGVEVVQFHPEYAPGQFEVSVAAESPVGAADTSVLVRATIRAVAARHGLRVSFAPSVVAGQVGNGGHVHLSFAQEGRTVMSGGPGPAGLTDTGEHAVAGILERLPALLAVGAPGVASYLRLVPSHWAGVFACWGVENREAAVRFVPGSVGEPEAANVEVKCVDLAADPYLLLAALLACATAGCRDRARLPEPVAADPATLPADARPARLPRTLDEALAAFVGDDVLRAAFGPELHDTLVAVRRAEIARFAGSSPDEIVAASRWTH